MTSFAAAGMGATFGGPAGVLISLGIELVVTNITSVTNYYNYFALFTILMIAVVSGERDARFMSVLMPIWAGFCMFAGWLKYPNAGMGFGILVVCTALAIMTFMQERVHERFGIAGPGNKVIKIFMYLIILQCVVVFINSSAIFPSETLALSASNTQYSNIDLTANIGSVSAAGGMTAQIVDIASIALQTAYSSLLLMIKCLISIAAFSLIVSQVFPWIAQAGPAGVGFLVVMQFAIWAMYLIFIFTVFYRPGPDPGW